MKQVVSIADQLGPLIQAARKSAGLSQTDLASRLGIRQSRMSAIELDPGSIRLEQLMTLCNALNLELQVQTKMPTQSDSASLGTSKAEW